jgi:hypothetical protein
LRTVSFLQLPTDLLGGVVDPVLAIVDPGRETAMTTHAEAKFTVDSWEENPWDEREGRAKMTRAEVTKSFEGDLEGKSTLLYLMTYRPNGSADFVGMERIVGTLGGRRGSFVLRHVGAFEDGAASGTWTIVEGSGTDALEGIRGESEFFLPKGADAFPFVLDYELRQAAGVR